MTLFCQIHDVRVAYSQQTLCNSLKIGLPTISILNTRYLLTRESRPKAYKMYEQAGFSNANHTNNALQAGSGALVYVFMAAKRGVFRISKGGNK